MEKTYIRNAIIGDQKPIIGGKIKTEQNLKP